MNRAARQVSTNDGIDMLRGMAALMVVLFHMNQCGLGVMELKWTQAGLLGVNLFFTLSGFLIALCVMAPAKFDRRQYLENRARRILPNYFIALFLVIALVDVRTLIQVPIWEAVGDVVSHLFLIHGWFPEYSVSIMGPFWTLSHEWWFYVLMLAAAPVLRSGKWWLVPLVMASAALVARSGQVANWWRLPCGLNHPVALWDQFAIGIAAAGLTLRAPVKISLRWLRPVVLVIGLAIILWSFWKIWHTGEGIDPSKFRGGAFGSRVMQKFYSKQSNILWFSPILAVGTGALVWALWTAPVRKWRVPVLPWMGKVSYSTYLFHMPVVLCFMRGFKNLPPDSFWQQRWVAFSVVLVMVYAMSAFAYAFFEKPWLRRKETAPLAEGVRNSVPAEGN